MTLLSTELKMRIVDCFLLTWIPIDAVKNILHIHIYFSMIDIWGYDMGVAHS